MTPRLGAAYHEAGHAIMALCAMRTIERVEIDDMGGGKYYGRKGPAGDTMEQRLRWLALEMSIVAAGAAAQKFIDPHGMFRACSGDRADIEELKLMCEILTGDRAGRELLDNSRREAGRLVDRLFPLVKKLAKALNARGRLTGDEIWAVLGGKPGARNPDKEPAKQRTPSSPVLMARTGDAGFNLPAGKPPPLYPERCEAATRAFRRRHGAF